jgi:hypothetical protein
LTRGFWVVFEENRFSAQTASDKVQRALGFGMRLRGLLPFVLLASLAQAQTAAPIVTHVARNSEVANFSNLSAASLPS